MSTTTVNVSLLNVIGTAVATQVTFKLIGPPIGSGASLILTQNVSIMTAADGTGNVALEPGWYLVTFPALNSDQVVIQVPFTGPVSMSEITASSPQLLTSANIIDATAAGKMLLTATDVPAQRVELGLAPVAISGSYSDLTNTPALAAVATSGSYTDLINTPSPASTPNVLHVEQGGTATSGMGNPSAPYGYVRAAFLVALAAGNGGGANFLIKMGIGAFTVAETNGNDWPAWIQLAGAGKSLTSLSVTGSPGNNLMMTDAGNQSFALTASGGNGVPDTAGAGGNPGGSIVCVNCHGTATGGTASDAMPNVDYLNGGNGGSVTVIGGAVTANGGGGGNSYMTPTQTGWGGAGGAVTMTGVTGNGVGGPSGCGDFSSGASGAVSMVCCVGSGQGGSTPGVYGTGGNLTMIDCSSVLFAIGGNGNGGGAGSVTLTGCTYQSVSIDFANGGVFNDMSIGNTPCSSFFDGGTPPLPSSNTVTIFP